MPAQQASLSTPSSRADSSPVLVKMRIEIGSVWLSPAQLAGIDDGHVITLDETIDESVEVYAGDRLVARGQVVLIDDRYCVQLDEVFREQLPVVE